MVPDVYVIKIEDRYVVQLNDEGLPRVRINPYYRRLLSRNEAIDKVTKEYVEERLRSAQWLIKGMEQRNKTIYKVAESIVKFQGEFLDQGISHLRPMVLKDVAEDIEHARIHDQPRNDEQVYAHSAGYLPDEVLLYNRIFRRHRRRYLIPDRQRHDPEDDQRRRSWQRRSRTSRSSMF